MKTSVKINNQAGFTLIEIIMVVFFSAVLLAVLFGIYDWHGNVYTYQQALARVSTSNRTSLDTMESFVAQANQVLSSASVNGTNHVSSATSVVLRLPSIDSSNNVISGTYDKAAFYGSGTNFYLQLEPAASSSRKTLAKILSDSLQSVSFIYNSATTSQISKITVNMQSRQQAKKQTVTATLEQNIYLLNR